MVINGIYCRVIVRQSLTTIHKANNTEILDKCQRWQRLEMRRGGKIFQILPYRMEKIRTEFKIKQPGEK